MNQPPVEIYRQLRGLMGRMRTQQRLIECIRDNAEHTAPNLSGMPRGSLPRTMADSISLLVDLERGMEDLLAGYGALLSQVKPHIDNLPEPGRSMLNLRYVGRLSVGSISRAMNYTPRRVYQILQEAETA